jgi:hypothetical protein
MAKLLYLTQDPQNSFSFRRAVRPFAIFDIEEEMAAGGILPRLQEKAADALIIDSAVLGARTVEHIRVMREELRWFLQIPIIVIVTEPISEADEKSLYEAGANYVCKNVAGELNSLMGLISSLINYTEILKEGNPYIMEKR